MSEKLPSWHIKYPWYTKYLIATSALVFLVFGIDAVRAAMQSDTLSATQSGVFALSHGALLWIYTHSEAQATRVAWFVFLGLTLVALAAFAYGWFAR